MAPRRDLRWPSLAILVTGLLSIAPVGILAQSSTAVCLSSFNWMNNSDNQNPCLVSAYLQGACNSGQFTVDPLPVNTHYTGPYVDQQNSCQCSSVTYNTVSACGLCQNRTIISWTTWNTNCTTIYPGVFPQGIPDGTAVPQWAFQDVTTSNFFDVTLAQSVGDTPESTATNVQSTGSLTITTSTPSASLTNSPSTSTSGSTSSNNSSNTGAIAGGVVGGVVGVALIVGVIIFFAMKKKRSQILPSAQFTGHPPPSAYTSSSPGYADTTPFTPKMVQPRLYDPSDPSTFPASPPLTSASSNNIQSPVISYSSPSLHTGYYSGVPEI